MSRAEGGQLEFRYLKFWLTGRWHESRPSVCSGRSG
jgi:hypothetical protein